ncbi:MAG: 2-oxoglutarate ferredoxin oxidoreductase subunit beta [Oleiphilaceae bacterium]|jgi:2-oxoglutarate ferredoxin oxidoreductase subunit beta
MDNEVYGMTKGQASPKTPADHINDPIQTTAEIQRDDGFDLGLIYERQSHGWMPPHYDPDSESRILNEMAASFSV